MDSLIKQEGEKNKIDHVDQGCTSLLLLVDRAINQLLVANVGDSRFVAAKDGRPIFSTIDHTA